MTLGYPGTTVRTSMSSGFKAIGSAPVTSASPPVLIRGNISEATESTRTDFMHSTRRSSAATYPAGLGDELALLRAQAQLRGSSHDKHLDAAVLLPTELSVVAGNRKHLPE